MRRIIIAIGLVCIFWGNTNLLAQVNDTEIGVNDIKTLQLKLYEKEIELTKTNRTLGYVIAIPSVIWTGLSTFVSIAYDLPSEDFSAIAILASTLATAILSYIGIDMIIDSNCALSNLETSNPLKQNNLGYQNTLKYYELSFSLRI